MAVVRELKVVGSPSDAWVIEVGIFQLSTVLLVWGVYVAPFLSKKHIRRRQLIQELSMGRSPIGFL